MKITALLSAVLLLAALPATAQQMNYQGRLTDASGNALADGQQTLEFRLFDAATAGTEIWGPFLLDGTTGNGKGPRADLVNGRFNAVLGPLDTAGRPLTGAFTNTTRYLQIKVGANTPILPRQAILDTPTAMMAQRIPNVFTSGTNVGINEQAPAAPLQIAAGTSTSPASNGLAVYNPSNTAARHAIVSARVAGSSGGNPFVSWDVNGEVGWAMGIDNSDNKLKIMQDWSFASAPRMTIDTVGNVGVATTTPTGKFDVLGQVKSTGSSAEFSFDNRNNTAQRYVWYADSGGAKLWHSVAGDRLTVESNGNTTVAGVLNVGSGATLNGNTTFNGQVIGTMNVNFGGFNNCPVSIKGRNAGDTTLFDVLHSDGSERFRVQDYGIEVNSGNAFKPGGGAWGVYSDARLKKNVVSLTGALDRLLQLRPVTFEYNQPGKFGVTGVQTGFVAQEVEKVFPEWISEISAPRSNSEPVIATPEKYKTVNVKGFESLTVQALRELRTEKDTQIKSLTEENATLRDTVQEQEARLAKLEKAVTALTAAEDKPASTPTPR